MTVFNGEQYLAAAIESAITQTDQDWELIVFDDGSADQSRSIALSYAERDQRIKLIHADGHIGRAAALIAAFGSANGKYLGFLDADDLLSPDAIELTAAVLDQQPNVGMVYTNYVDMSECGQILSLGHRCQIPYSPDRLLIDHMTFHFRLMRSEIYQQVGGIDAAFSVAQDYDLCLKISEITNIYHLPKSLYYYRQNSRGISQTRRVNQIQYSAFAVRNALCRRKMTGSFRLDVEPPSTFRIVRI